jgi:serine/threonine-protein kinase
VSEPTPGEELGTLGDGRYVLKATLGVGASAVVYRAEDTELRVQRAVKVLHAASEVPEVYRKRLRGEARAMARLDHRHILRVHDIGQEEEQYYVVMDLAEGGNLASLMEQWGPMSEARALGYGLQVLSALAAAHAQGIVHRDIKPHNILLDSHGLALLGDFGVALLSEDDALRSTRTGVALGTLAFMAPEQRLDARSVGPEADLYAVGATLYFLITGDNPVDLFAADPDSARWAGVTEPVREILVRATRYKPDRRYQEAAAMARDVTAALDDANEMEPDPLDPRTFPPPSERIAGPSQAGGAPTAEWVAATTDATTYLLSDLDEGVSGTLAPPRPARRSRRALVVAVIALLALGGGAVATILLLPDVPTVPAELAAGEEEGVAVGSTEEPPPEVVVASAEETPPETEPVGDAEASAVPAGDAAADAAPGTESGRPAPETVATPSPPPAVTSDPAPSGTSEALERPLGVWTGAFGGRLATFSLGGTFDRITGTVSVHMGAKSVETPVVGAYDPDRRELTLEDQINVHDSGRYSATLSEDGTVLEGQFEGIHNARLVKFKLTAAP